MVKAIKEVSFAFFLAAIFVTGAQAASTYSAASCNESDVQAAVNSACTWSMFEYANYGVQAGQTYFYVAITVNANSQRGKHLFQASASNRAVVSFRRSILDR
jgi:hypothetical protein